jgi:hypothetical protein
VKAGGKQKPKNTQTRKQVVSRNRARYQHESETSPSRSDPTETISPKGYQGGRGAQSSCLSEYTHACGPKAFLSTIMWVGRLITALTSNLPSCGMRLFRCANKQLLHRLYQLPHRLSSDFELQMKVFVVHCGIRPKQVHITESRQLAPWHLQGPNNGTDGQKAITVFAKTLSLSRVGRP